MIRAVLDTNIFISAFFWRGAPHKLIRYGLGGKFIIITSLAILDEVYAILKEKFVVPEQQINSLIKILSLNSEIVYPTMRLLFIKDDPTDNKIIECAIEGAAEYIVSGDRHLLSVKKYKYIEIVSPDKFLKKF